MKPTEGLKFLLPELNEAQLQVIERYVSEQVVASHEPRPSIESCHNFPAKSNGFKPWNNKYGDYTDWSLVPAELFKCTKCGVDWGKAIRSNVRKCQQAEGL